MGLDMYLRKKILTGWMDMDKLELSYSFRGKNVPIDVVKVRGIVIEAGYWRKANAIHKWFVDNVQDGEDDCGEYYVSPENMQMLLDDINNVLEHAELAEDLLPTEDGFFFGSTDYDEWYKKDLEDTKKIIESALEDLKSENGGIFSYYYSSSW